MLRWNCFVSALVTLVIFAGPALAQSAGEPPSAALLEDAASYAQIYDVELDEAVARLRLQAEAGDLNDALRTEEASDFAGLWIEHVPQFRVVTRFRGAAAAEQRLAERLAANPLAGRVEVRRAARSLAQLEEHLTVARHMVRQLDVQADLSVNVFDNRVEILTVDPPGLRNRLDATGMALPGGVALVEVAEMPQPEATLVGGTPASTCTGGFTVRKSNGDLGISTAAHCGNTQSFLGSTLPFRSEDQQGNQDVQWHSACDIHEVTNEFNSGIGLRSCIGTRGRSQQAIGSLVCKYGKTTGRTCGEIESNNYAPWWVTSAASTFMWVDGDDVNGMTVNLSEGGDSGGPWFVEDIAYGIHSGGGGNDAIYMPINYISSIGVSVLTFDPGPGCNLSPVASATHTLSGSYATFDASASYDPDGSIVSYHWNFGDGTSTTTTSSTISHFYSSTGSYAAQLTVTDNEGATAFTYEFVYIAGDCDDGRVLCEEPML